MKIKICSIFIVTLYLTAAPVNATKLAEILAVVTGENRLFFTAEQRAKIDSELSSPAKVVVEPETPLIVPVVPRPLKPLVKLRRENLPRPKLNGYLVAGDQSVVWLDGKPLIEGRQYGERMVESTRADTSVVIKSRGKTEFLQLEWITRLGGKLVLEVR